MCKVPVLLLVVFNQATDDGRVAWTKESKEWVPRAVVIVTLVTTFHSLAQASDMWACQTGCRSFYMEDNWGRVSTLRVGLCSFNNFMDSL